MREVRQSPRSNSAEWKLWEALGEAHRAGVMPRWFWYLALRYLDARLGMRP
jgi:hypothetical protein